jgi:hypothetical protein
MAGSDANIVDVWNHNFASYRFPLNGQYYPCSPLSRQFCSTDELRFLWIQNNKTITPIWENNGYVREPDLLINPKWILIP